MNRRQQENGHPRARPSRARAAAAATREQGGPQSRAQGPPVPICRRMGLAHAAGNAASRTAATTPPQRRSLPSLPCKTTPRRSPKAIRSFQGDARQSQAHPPDTAGARIHPRWRSPPGLPLPFAALRVCHSLGQLSGQARSCRKRALGAGAGRPQLCCPTQPGCPSGAAGLWPRARGCAGCGEQKGRQQQGAELHRPPTGFFVPGAFT
jgi:hypothetical protein